MSQALILEIIPTKKWVTTNQILELHTKTYPTYPIGLCSIRLNLNKLVKTKFIKRKKEPNHRGYVYTK